MAASLRISAPTYVECGSLLPLSRGEARVLGVARREKAEASGKFYARPLTLGGGMPPYSKMSAPIRSLFNPAAKVTIRANFATGASMTHNIFSRRDFSRLFGQSLALALAVPQLPKPLDAQRRGPIPEGAVRLNFNENPYGPSPKALEALAACGSIAHRYPDQTYIQVKDALAQKFNLTRDNIALGCGSTEILHGVDAAFLDSSRRVVAPEPTFEAVLEYARALHAQPVKIPLTPDHRHDLPKMAAACTSKTGVVYVCNPNNPTGTIVTRDEMATFIQAVPPATLILVDEAYYDFADDPRYASATEFIAKNPNVVVARTFSKIYGMAGMRLGYAIGAKEPITLINNHLTQDNGNAAVLAAALVSLGDSDYVASCRTRINDTRRWLCAELAKDSRTFIPSQANFVMIDMGSDAQPFIDQFRARNIIVGRRFASIPNFLRVSIGTQQEIESFVTALREIAPTRSSKAAA
jgi:histidinol-phosphate aminotransferase